MVFKYLVHGKFINYIFSKDVDEEHEMHSKNDNTELQTYDNANDVVGEPLELFLSREQFSLETSMRGRVYFQFNCCIKNVNK